MSQYPVDLQYKISTFAYCKAVGTKEVNLSSFFLKKLINRQKQPKLSPYPYYLQSWVRSPYLTD